MAAETGPCNEEGSCSITAAEANPPGSRSRRTTRTSYELVRRQAPSWGNAVADRGPYAGSWRRDPLDQLDAAHGGGSRGQGRVRRFLDLPLHQLAPHARVRPRVGGEVSRAWVAGRWGPHSGVPVRARVGERPRGGARPARRLSDRAR